MEGADFLEDPAPWLAEGRNSIRTLTPATGFTTLAAQTVMPHWRPTVVVLPDDRVLVMGGYESLFGPPTATVTVFNPLTNVSDGCGCDSSGHTCGYVCSEEAGAVE